MSTVNFLWNPLNDNIVREFDDAGTVIAEYTTEANLFGNVVSQRRNGQDNLYHYDGQGSTLALTDANGDVTDTYAYSAFGEVNEHTGSEVNPFQYIGQKQYYRDEETGAYEVRRRPLVQGYNRWLTVDIVTPNGGNMYTYVTSNPNRFIDPSGLKKCEIRIYAGHFLPGTAIDEIGKILDKLKDVARDKLPTRIGGVGCFPGTMQAKIKKQFPGRTIPGMPGGNAPLEFEEAPEALQAAYDAAVAELDALCKAGCDSIYINIVCTPDMIKAIKRHATNPDQKKLCDNKVRTQDPFQNHFLCK